MDIREILRHVDHTLLKPEATWDQIKTLCDEAMEFDCASVCIPPCYVKQAAEYVQGNLKICTVIGFPHGNSTAAAKMLETKDAVENGASEIDMVVNVGFVKDRRWKEIGDEIAGVKAACLGRTLKVILETCLLTDMEKVRLCQICTKAGADYVKTSTGFSTGGATREDVKLLRESCPPEVKVKVSGGIFVDMTIHDFDMVRYLSGSEVEEVSTFGACLVDPEIGKAGDVDTCIINLKFANGALGVIDNSRQAVYGYDQRIEVFGSKGMISAENETPNNTTYYTADGVYREKPLWFFLERYNDAFIQEETEFVKACLEDTETPVGSFDGLQPVRIAIAAKKSWELGGVPKKKEK